MKAVIFRLVKKISAPQAAEILPKTRHTEALIRAAELQKPATARQSRICKERL
jgi:hypothetical protein